MRHASTIVKTAAIVMMGIPVTIFPAAAQQMAAGTQNSSAPDFSACDRMHQTNPSGAIQCRVDALKTHSRQMQQESAEAKARSARAEAIIQSETVLSTCISFLSAKKASGITFDRPITRENACAEARRLGMTNG